MEPSDESRHLEAVVVPQVMRWVEGSSPTFDLSRFALAQGYESVCQVDQYQSLTQIEHYIEQEVRAYSSSFGRHVPENHMALVFVRNQNAYAALLPLLRVGGNFHVVPVCVKSTSIKYRRVKKDRNLDDILLEGAALPAKRTDR